MSSLTDYATFQQWEWVYGVLDVYFGTKTFSTVLLSGNAGVGKSHALKSLMRTFASLGMGHACLLTATTKAAAGALGHGARTFHSALGINTADLLDDSLSCGEFLTLYKRKYKVFYGLFEKLLRANPLIWRREARHPCERLSGRCSKCLDIVRRHFLDTAGGFVPPCVHSPIVIVDEYGMLSARDFGKLCAVLNSCSLPGYGHLLVLTGSVTQLPPASVKEGIWTCRLLAQSILHTRYLSISHRHSRDLGFSEAVDTMQYNLVTRMTTDVIGSRTLGESESGLVLDPDFMPGVLRLFHDNVSRDTFNRLVAEKASPGPQLPLAPQWFFESRVDSYSIRRFKETALSRFRFNFSPEVKNHLVFEGAQVLLTRCKQVDHTAALRGTVESIVGTTLVVRGEDGETYMLEEEVFTSTSNPGCSVSFLPVSLCYALNTYTSQGQTIPWPVIYNPPKCNFFRSPLKASAYVACTRVTRREDLFVSCNTFANTPGQFPFFDAGVILFKKRWEQGYIPAEHLY